MRKFQLMTTENKNLYEGYHHNLTQAVEYAISQNIQLHGINLSDADLQHINLDGVRLNDGNLKGANLSGANMSEGEFINCDFSATDLSNACLCYTNFSKCNFRYSFFAGIDIAMSSLILCDFQGLSALQIDYHKAFNCESLTFTHFENIINFSTPPTIIKQGKRIVAIFDNVMIFNDIQHTFDYIDTPESILNHPVFKMQSLVDSK
jgi:uncharacterized protein YjbI with pentapeptide repeats